jgi:threonine dehydrogenase-like Zn-dependent dehydrogenase
VKYGLRVLIGGAGPVGFLTMLLCKAAGATTIGMTDINDKVCVTPLAHEMASQPWGHRRQLAVAVVVTHTF